MTASLYQSGSTGVLDVAFGMGVTVGATMGGAQSILKLETAFSRGRGTVGLLFLLLILIVLMILPERMDAQGKIRSKITSMSKRFDVSGTGACRLQLRRNAYFFGSAMACAATHCHSPLRSTHVSVKR